MKRALVIGAEGQDGTYLTKVLRDCGYSVIGIDKNKTFLDDNLFEKQIDILSQSDIENVINEFTPHEIYHLAAYHHSSEEKEVDELSLFNRSVDINVNSLVYILDAAKNIKTKIFYAASSHLYGNPVEIPQNENTVIAPNCIYGITKATAVNICNYYRENKNIFVSIGILYNHESPLRKSTFLSKKIVETAIAIKKGEAKQLTIGDLNAEIDWGYAPDYVEAMRKIISYKEPETFIIASGKSHRVIEFVDGVFSHLGLRWRDYVIENSGILKKIRKNNLRGDSSKLKRLTGWRPKVDFENLIRLLIENELEKHNFI